MNVILLHDPQELPVDVFQAVQDAGHRAASHGADAPALEGFLSAVRWTPDAFIVDFRGRHAWALNAAEWLAKNHPGTRLVLAFVPASIRVKTRQLAPHAVLAEGAGSAAEAIAQDA